MLMPSPISVPSDKKLVDDAEAQKLQQRVDEIKRSYRPEQGWLDSQENQVRRSR